MAAICASRECVLLTNGKTAAFIYFRYPEKIQVLEIPLPNNKSLTQVVSKKQQNVTKQDKKQEGNRQKGQKENVAQETQEADSEDRSKSDNHILACALSSNGQLVALCDDRKFLHVYKVDDGVFQIQFSSPLVHRCTSATITRDNECVIVADKSGDAYVFNVVDQVRGQISKSNFQESLHEVEDGVVDSQDKNDSRGGSLLLGHHSMLIDVLMVDKFVVTCDRDEKIRISHYPDAHNIQAFCLGHTQFVVSLAYDETRKILMSGSGDATVRLWNTDGKELHRRNVLPDIPMDDRVTSTDTNTEEVGNQDSRGVKSDSHQSQTTIKQISFCSDYQILFVVIYKCPHILAYKLLDANDNGHLTTQLISVMRGQDIVVSMCVSYSVVWVVRQGVSRLSVSAYRVQSVEGIVEMIPVSDDTSNEFLAVRTFTNHDQLLQVPPISLDLMPSLWKLTYQEDSKHKNSSKRLTAERESGQTGKKHKKV